MTLTTTADFDMDDKTKETLKRFSDSWMVTEAFYDDLINNHSGFERLKPIEQFIKTLRQDKQDRFFRLGTSVHVLVISRSVDYGLRKDQKCIKIDAFDSSFEVTFCDGDRIYRQYLVDSLSDVKVTQLLATLKSTLVD